MNSNEYGYGSVVPDNRKTTKTTSSASEAGDVMGDINRWSPEGGPLGTLFSLLGSDEATKDLSGAKEKPIDNETSSSSSASSTSMVPEVISQP